MQEILLGIGSTPEEEELGFFLGEVPVNEFITGSSLASEIGLTAGTSQFSDEPWLKFLDPVDGKTKYVAKKTYRHSVTWDHLNARGAVFGTTTVTIQGDTYKVRLLKGAASDPISGGNGQHDPEQSWGSEWNRLLYPLVPNPTNVPTRPVSREGIRYGEWANYAEADLGITTGNSAGQPFWCQETNADNATQRVIRGRLGVSGFDMGTSSNTKARYGWRPVLELIED